MTRTLERLLRLQRGDFPRGLLLFAYLFLVICAYLVGQVARDSLFLGRFDASLLPFADVSLFLVVAVVIALYVRAARRVSLDRLISGSLLAFGGLGLVFAVLARSSPGAWLYPIVYVWVGVLGVLAPAQVWTLANYVLTPREARRLFGFVGAGATLGATVGGFLSSALARRFGAESLLVAVAVFLLVASSLVSALWRKRLGALRQSVASGPERVGLRASLRLVLDSPHLRAITVIVVLSSFVTAVASWQFKAIAQQALVRKDAMAAFFGTFNAWVGVLCVATQLLLTSSVLRRLGLGPVLFLLPIGLLGGSAGLLTLATLAAAVMLKGVDKVLRYSIDRPAMELLYLPVPTAIKLPAKSFIDTVAWRAGDALAGLAVLALATLGGLPPRYLGLVTLPAIGIWLMLASRVHHRYVATLEESLQQHKLDAERAQAPVLDRETAEVLASRLGAVDPKEILYALELLGSGSQATAAHPALRGLLDHADAEVRRRALAVLSEAGDLSVTARAETLLHDPDLDVRTEALLYLSRHAHVDPLARLQDLADFPEHSVRSAIVAVLVRLGDGRLEAAQPLFAAMVAEAGERGRRTRLEAARLAERMPLPFEESLRLLVKDEDAEVARTAIRAVARADPQPYADLLIARLGEPSLAGDAKEALLAAGEDAVAALAVALADRRTPTAARRAIPEVLERAGGDAAVEALTDNLLDGDAALRLRILVALGGARDARPGLEIDTRLLESALGAEVLGHYRSYQILGTILTPGPGQQPVERGLRAAMREELERIFRLLDLLHPRRDFRAAWVALQSGNAVIHDQALDLLESLLRPETKALLVPLVDPEIAEPQRVRLAQRLVGAPVETTEQGIEALACTGDPWLRSCAAYAIGSLGLGALAHHLEAWRDDPDPLLRETVRQARRQLSQSPRA
ncbi:MAG TPA: Npt1/Npt2 family nucleotide transporter [Vicinamibacteria bacterium]|jgi:AAA family ATP:ADP antiporter